MQKPKCEICGHEKSLSWSGTYYYCSYCQIRNITSEARKDKRPIHPEIEKLANKLEGELKNRK